MGPDRTSLPPFPMMKWVLVTLLLAAPPIVILFGLFVFGDFEGWPVWIASLVMLMIYGCFCRFLIRDIADLRQYSTLASHFVRLSPPRLAAAGLTGDLGEAISRLIAVSHEDRRLLSNDIQALQSVLDRLPDPIFMVSANLSILQANQSAVRFLPDPSYRGSLSGVFRNPSLLETMTDALSGETPQQTEIEFPGPPQFPGPPRRIYEIWVARFPKPLNNGGCALLRMLDRTEVKRVEQLHADFIANASHELKTPLATLAGYIETLKDSIHQDPATAGDFLKIMDDEAQRMKRLIFDLLSLSRIERQEHAPPEDRVDLRAVIDEVMTLIRPLSEQNHQKISIEFHENADVLGDRDQLIQVFLNLLDNAIKYGASPDPVQVIGKIVKENRQSFLCVSVIDRGQGIDPSHHSRLSERFYRVDTARSRALGGTGLGLAIVKHILTRHKGRLDILSTPGKGSVFTVLIPVVADDRS